MLPAPPLSSPAPEALPVLLFGALTFTGAQIELVDLRFVPTP